MRPLYDIADSKTLAYVVTVLVPGRHTSVIGKKLQRDLPLEKTNTGKIRMFLIYDSKKYL